MSMSKFEICLRQNAINHDLSKREIETINDLIADQSVVISREKIAVFMKVIGKEGYAFCPSTFKGERNEFKIKSPKTFKQSRLFVLSFDNLTDGTINEKLSFEEIEDRAKQYGLPMLFAYKKDLSRWTETKRREFSIGFLNETPITDLREAEAVQKALMMIFPEAEKDCSVLKLYEGGRGGLLHSDKTMPTINAEWLFMNMCLYLRNRFGLSNYKRKIAEFSRKTGIRLDDRKLPDVSVVEHQAEYLADKIDDKKIDGITIYNGKIYDKNLSKCITNKTKSDKNLSHVEYRININDQGASYEKEGVLSTASTSDNYSTTSTILSPYSSDMLSHLRSRCKLYQEFESGSKRLHQQELLGLATNLYQIKSGKKKFDAILSSKTYEGFEKLDNWDYYFYYIKGKGSKPCTYFCPYHDTCQHGKDILATAKPKYHQIVKLANCGEPLVSLDEAWEDFNKKFQKAITSSRPCWHVIKSQTALGKTEAVLKFLEETSLNVLVVVPTNRLKREVRRRAKRMGIKLAVSPSLHELQGLIPDDIWDDIQALYDEGKSPIPRIKKSIAKNEEGTAKIFEEYINELSKFAVATGHAVTTHRRLPSLNLSKYDLIIVDEDIIYSTVIPSRETISLSDLRRLKKKLAASDSLAAKIKKILKKAKDHDFFTLEEIDYYSEYADIEMAVNIPALCSATHFCYRSASKQDNNLEKDSITFIKPVEFPNDKKYIMLSATADEKICKYYWGEENVRFYNCKKAVLTGTLYQYGDRPMGRSSIRKDPSTIEKIKKWTGFDYTISFKEFHKYYTGDMHFGNCAGCDTLKGENIDVIGTPHQPEWIYKLFAYSIGIDVDDILRPNTSVIHNGFQFRFMTYAEGPLRDIQFYMVESELEQAVGRARLLRCDCTVNLFSDYPLEQAVLRKSEYDTDEDSQST